MLGLDHMKKKKKTEIFLVSVDIDNYHKLIQVIIYSLKSSLLLKTPLEFPLNDQWNRPNGIDWKVKSNFNK